MKFLVAFAFVLLLQSAIAQEIQKDHKPDHGHQGNIGVEADKHGVHIPDDVHKQPHVVEHQVLQADPSSMNEVVKPTSQHSAGGDSQSSVVIPPKVQHLVNQVTQHIPQVVAQHVATQNKDRVVRSIDNRRSWQSLQVGAVEQPGKCEFICHDSDVSICGYNGHCYHKFESQCELNTYNCLNSPKIFHIVDSVNCKAGESLEKCYRGHL